MAHYRDYSQEQAQLLPISLQQQIQSGTIEHTINYLVEKKAEKIEASVRLLLASQAWRPTVSHLWT
jgi:hypothetical protein